MACGRIAIGTNKPAHPGIIVPGLEVIEAGFLVIDIAPIAEGVLPAEGVGQGAGAGEGIAPGVIGVFDHDLAGIVGDGDNVALGVVKIEVLGAVEANGHGLAVGIAADAHDIGAVEDVDELALGIGIAGDYIVDGLREAKALLVIGKGDGSAVLGHGSELAAALPGIGPGAVGDEVANGIIGAGLAGIGGEQVLPSEGVVIAIGDGVEGFAQRSCGISIFDAGESSSCQNIAIKEKSAPEGAERRIVAILVYQEAALLFLAQLRKGCVLLERARGL